MRQRKPPILNIPASALGKSTAEDIEKLRAELREAAAKMDARIQKDIEHRQRLIDSITDRSMRESLIR